MIYSKENSRRLRRINRARLARRLFDNIDAFYQTHDDALVGYLSDENRMRQIKEYFSSRYATPDQREKAIIREKISEADRDYLMTVLLGFNPFSNVDDFVNTVLKLQMKETFGEAARFSLGKLGVSVGRFDLRNPNLLDALDKRAQTFVSSAQVRYDNAIDVLTRNFIERGFAPYNREFLNDIRNELGYTSNVSAERFAMTETGVITESANMESFRKMGVQKKQWLIGLVNVRPTHRVLRNETIEMHQKFNVGGHWADHPLDVSLPPEELINCHCTLAPAGDQVINAKPWTGE